MNTDWTCSSKELPRDGQQIEFVLDHRSVAMEGAYISQTFRSRWAEYTIERVRSWRDRTLCCERAATVATGAACALSSMAKHALIHDSSLAGELSHAA